ncbi:hypothetical protein CRUP_033123, partial [Coryphaenoides rupestris]
MDLTSAQTPAGTNEGLAGRGRPKASRAEYVLRKLIPKKIPSFPRPKRKPKVNVEENDAVTPERPLTFGEMLDQELLAEASTVLIYREDQLFSRGAQEPDLGALQLSPGPRGASGGGGGGEEEVEVVEE